MLEKYLPCGPDNNYRDAFARYLAEIANNGLADDVINFYSEFGYFQEALVIGKYWYRCDNYGFDSYGRIANLEFR